MSQLQELRDRIESRQARIGVIGFENVTDPELREACATCCCVPPVAHRVWSGTHDYEVTRSMKIRESNIA